MSIDITESDILSPKDLTSNLDLSSTFVNTNLRNKRGLILLVYSDGCPACRIFKEQSFMKFMQDMNAKGDILVKVLPLHRPGVGQEFNALVRNSPIKKFEVMYIPTVLSFDNQGRYFSTYGEEQGGKYQYRSVEDLQDYANGIGDYTINFKVVKPNA